MKPLISVIIPIYNVESYLNRCIDSILGQSYENVELILVNDGSTDKSLEICLDYQSLDNRVKVFSKENGGVSSARNMGIKESAGEYIMFVDSDDWISNDTLEILFKDIDKNNSDIAICDFSYSQVDFHREAIGSNDTIIMDRKRVIKKVLRREYSSVCAKLYKKNVIEGVWFKEDIDNNEDVLFLYYVFNKVNSVTHNFKAKKYHINREPRKSLSSFKCIGQINNQLNILSKIEKEVGENKIFKDDLNICRAITYYNTCADYIVSNTCNNQIWKECYKGFRNSCKKIIFIDALNFKTKIKFLILFISPKLFSLLKTKFTERIYFTD